MLRQTHRAYGGLLFLADTLATAAAWIAAYWLRMAGLPVPLAHAAPPFGAYVLVLPVALAATWLAFRAANLYRARPEGGPLADAGRVVRACLLGLVFLLAAMFFLSRFEYSRVAVATYAGLQPVLVVAGRAGARRLAASLRRRGWGVRRALVLGAGFAGQRLVDALRRRPALGIEPVGFCDDRATRRGKAPRGLPVMGGLDDAAACIAAHRIDEVFVALPLAEWGRTEQVLEALATEVVDVRLVTPLGASVDILRATTGELDNLPIVSLRDTPLRGFNVLAKRALDLVVAGTAVAVLGLPMLVIALLVKLTSRGPVFYRQERMGLDGRTFPMLKFRSMRVDAEAQTGAVWAKKDDDRRTPIGTFLRGSSIDELPQLLNVLLGQMSIVGPRPERPVFIEQFRRTVPRYHLRPKVKAGITGWAPVNGWRGDTSLRKRIQYDLDYIRRWSLWFDVRIMALTIFRGMVAPNAY